MEENLIENLYEDLRKTSEGKVAIFLGAGASYDYGIPTMKEMAQMLIDELKGSSNIFDKESIDTIKNIIGVKESKTNPKEKTETVKWNIEDLLTRLHRIQEAIGSNPSFPELTAKIEEVEFSKEKINKAESKLIEFLVKCYDLNICDKTQHGDKSIEYLSNFIEFLGEFHNQISIFTTNSDLCVEAAVMRLTQLPRNHNRKKFYLIDGFSNGILPIFSIANFTSYIPKASDSVVIYLWKLHGSIDWTFTNPIKEKMEKEDEFKDESIICKCIADQDFNKFKKAKAISDKITLHSSKIMIFPTPSKYSQTYSNPYMDLYQAFRKTLETVEMLLVVGTTFPDGHINSAIKAFLGRDSSMLYTVDPNLDAKTICSILGECDGIKPVIKKGFKDFIKELRLIEANQEKEGANE